MRRPTNPFPQTRIEDVCGMLKCDGPARSPEEVDAMIIRIPRDKCERLKQIAKSRNVSVNRLIEEMATIAISEHDAEVRFRARAARGNVRRGLKLLDKLDRPGVRKAQFAHTIARIHARNAGVPTRVIEREIEEAVRAVRSNRARPRRQRAK